MLQADISKFQKAKEWRDQRASNLFPTDASWEWFKRCHKNELIRSGALIARAGRAGDLVHIDRIDPAVQHILEAESLKKIDVDSPCVRVVLSK